MTAIDHSAREARRLKTERRAARRGVKRTSARGAEVTTLFPPVVSGLEWGTGAIIDAIIDAQKSGRVGELRAFRRLAKGATKRLIDGAVQEAGPGGKVEGLGGTDRTRSRRRSKVAEFLERRWGTEFRDPDVTLARIRALPPVSLISESLAQWLISCSSVPGITADEWRQAQTFCVLSDIYLKDLAGYWSEIPKIDDEHRAVLDRMSSILDPKGVERITAADQSGANWLALATHTGVFRFGRWYRNEFLLKGPYLMLGAAKASSSKRRFASVKTDPTGAFMQLVRHLRTPGGTAGLALDGQYGNSKYEMELLGRRIKLATGPAHAVYYSKCRAFLFLSRWRDGKVTYDLIDGPAVNPKEAIGDWTERWFDGIRPALEDMITGDPANIRGYSGIWSLLSGEGDDDED